MSRLLRQISPINPDPTPFLTYLTGADLRVGDIIHKSRRHAERVDEIRDNGATVVLKVTVVRASRAYGGDGGGVGTSWNTWAYKTTRLVVERSAECR